jgi:hypothetical protein
MFCLFKKEAFSNVPKELRPVLNAAFPKGEEQLDQEAKGLLGKFPDLFTLESARSLVIWAKTMWVTNSSSPDRHLSFKDMCEAINRHENNRLTNKQCADIYTKILEQDFSTRRKS